MSTTLFNGGPFLSNSSTGTEGAISATQGNLAAGQMIQMPVVTGNSGFLSPAGVALPPVSAPVGSSSVSGGQQYGSLRFYPAGGFANAAFTADLVMPGGKEASCSWYINLYTIAGGLIPALPPTSVLFMAGPLGGGLGNGTDCWTSSTAGTLASGFQPIYTANGGGASNVGNGGTIPSLRFVTNSGAVNGQNVVDLVLPGGKEASASWYLVVYAFSGGFLT